MNIYNVTYLLRFGTMTVITIAKSSFDAQKQMEIKTHNGIKKVLGMKGVKCTLATNDDIKSWAEMLEQIDDQHQLDQVKKIIREKVG